MHIKFTAIGLTFEAGVKYTPGMASSWDDPGFGSEVEIEVLSAIHAPAPHKSVKVDAMFLLDSDVAHYIEAAAHTAADEEYKVLKDEAKLERYFDSR